LKHANVALFVPHNGCPHQCSFCSQRTITGRQEQPAPEDVVKAAEIAEKSLGAETQNAEIAFFGGSFTAIDRAYMVSLLEAAYPFVKSGRFKGIRVSTRPDYIDVEVLSVLKKYGVTTIELGAQSMDDRVLGLNGRGHTSKQVEDASKLISAEGFTLGLQMMTGLYGDTAAGAVMTAQKLAGLKPQNVRIYPTIILRSTELGERYLKGEYKTLSLDETVGLCARLLDFFESRGIEVIRLGLHASRQLERDMLSGPWHPAFGELCESRRFFNKVMAYTALNGVPKGELTVAVNPKDISVAKGQKKSNIQKFYDNGYNVEIKTDKSVKQKSFTVV